MMRPMPRFRSRSLILWLAGVASAILVLPYALTLQRTQLESLPVPLPLLLIASVLQSALLLAVAVFLGLRAADAVGLRTPLTNAIAARTRMREAFQELRPLSAALIGAAAGLSILALETLVFRPLIPEFTAAAGHGGTVTAGGLPRFVLRWHRRGDPDPALPGLRDRVDLSGEGHLAGDRDRRTALCGRAPACRSGVDSAHSGAHHTNDRPQLVGRDRVRLALLAARS